MPALQTLSLSSMSSSQPCQANHSTRSNQSFVACFPQTQKQRRAAKHLQDRTCNALEGPCKSNSFSMDARHIRNSTPRASRDDFEMSVLLSPNMWRCTCVTAMEDWSIAIDLHSSSLFPSPTTDPSIDDIHDFECELGRVY